MKQFRSLSHSYDGIRDKNASEYVHMMQINERMTKISHEVFRKTAAEKQQTKDAINGYVNKNHKPMNRLPV